MPFFIPLNRVTLTTGDFYLWIKHSTDNSVGYRITLHPVINVKPIWLVEEATIYPAYYAPFAPTSASAVPSPANMSGASSVSTNEYEYDFYHDNCWLAWTLPAGAPAGMNKIMVRTMARTSGGDLKIRLGTNSGTVIGTVVTDAAELGKTPNTLINQYVSLSQPVGPNDTIVFTREAGLDTRLYYWVTYNTEAEPTDDQPWFSEDVAEPLASRSLPLSYDVSVAQSTPEFAYALAPSGNTTFKFIGGAAHNGIPGFCEERSIVSRWYRNGSGTQWTKVVGWTNGTFTNRINSTVYYSDGTTVLGNLDYTYAFDLKSYGLTHLFTAGIALDGDQMYTAMFTGVDYSFNLAKLKDRTEYDLTGSADQDPVWDDDHPLQVPIAKIDKAKECTNMSYTPKGAVARVRVLASSPAVYRVFFRHTPSGYKDKVYFQIAPGAIQNGATISGQWAVEFAVDESIDPAPATGTPKPRGNWSDANGNVHGDYLENSWKDANGIGHAEYYE